ncbi:[protein-PII] uridylyltransferase [Thiomicrospira sp. ALE5]|uniref:[protein-PII] uridylyltransferase n=1 Tax=Thiomicrospira sp. ALE5 TaxID=748650 RepID=UPI0008EE6544|nr:[protein-PII] uridylyltransferase [Thiomicrospira sp. ALE5]SFR48929.1 UTP--GlnB (protein PII) uridylyltransferase, GlnD [Thiomicrospira sp. ALE5]
MTSSNPPVSFMQALNDPQHAAKVGRDMLKQFNDTQFERFDQGQPVSALVLERATFIDQILKKIWHHYFNDAPYALLAVGGYGRGELHPYSDVDILILRPPLDADPAQLEQQNEQLSDFIRFLWDLGLEVGHAIRTLEDCYNEGLSDITTATNLLEARWITGHYSLFEQLQDLWHDKQFWPSQTFYQAKIDEQTARHRRFNDTVYQLEPNLKESPGGLRDIQTIIWVAKRHYHASSLHQLVQNAFITPEEYRELDAAYKFLNRARFILHRLKKRREDRLLFDNQQQIAQVLGYENTDEKLAVEQFMNSYYRNVQVVVKLNEILLQHFLEDIFNDTYARIVAINSRFQLRNGYLDVCYDQVFNEFPTALLEIFIILEDNPSIQGIRARTIRLLRNALHLIDPSFRQDPINKALFMAIFRQPKGVNAALKRMHSYGLLAAYIPAFQKISGLMQFNIFHAYTVDEHTLLVIRNLRRFFIKDYAYEFPTAHQVANNIAKPEVLFLAALFHDIAKGRKGAHEILGEVDAREFAVAHNLPERDTELIAWLVRYHLEFSTIAQRKDLTDPEVIEGFRQFVGTQERLDYLYLLTLADVRSTSKEVWNDWKNVLFLELYNETATALDKAEEIPRDKAKKALIHQERAREMLHKQGLKPQDYQGLWQALKDTAFFNRHSPKDLTRLTSLLAVQIDQATIIAINGTSHRGASELILLAKNRDFMFAQITQVFESLGLTVVEAKVYTSNDNRTLVLFYFLDRHNQPVQSEEDLARIRYSLEEQLATEGGLSPVVNHSHSRRIKYFSTPTEIHFKALSTQLTELTVITKDIPGLLSKVGRALRDGKIRLHDAKIVTIGEKAEDIFLVSDINNQALGAAQQNAFTERLMEYLG